MASIFANSYFTIIAADGSDANYGLHGVDSESSPRYHKETIFRFSESVPMVAQPEVEPFWLLRYGIPEDGLSRNVQCLGEPLCSLENLSTGNVGVPYGMKNKPLSQMVFCH
jgi:hypothetical protein